jgi:hypothetical protein
VRSARLLVRVRGVGLVIAEQGPPQYGLALEEIAGALAPVKVPITDRERSDVLALTATMNTDNLITRALGSARVPDTRADVRMVNSGRPLRNGARP